MFIKMRPTKGGMTFHIGRKVAGRSTFRKVPARNMKEAREYLRMAEGEFVQGKPISLYLEEVTFQRLVSEYRDYSQSRKAISTYRKDGSVVKVLLEAFGGLNLGQITAQRIQEAQSIWSRSGRSNKTINNRSILLGTMLRFAMERNYLASIPKISKYKVDVKRPQFFTNEEIDLILTNANHFLRDYVKFLLYTGLRRGELQRLKWEHVDIINKQIHVELSKSHKFRTIPMHTDLYNLIIDLIRQRTDRQVYVFECNEGKMVSDYTHRFKKLLRRLGIEGHLHKLRHTFASRLVQQSVSVYSVRDLMGHASVQTTQVYAHNSMESLQNAVNMLEFGRTVATPEAI